MKSQMKSLPVKHPPEVAVCAPVVYDFFQLVYLVPFGLFALVAKLTGKPAAKLLKRCQVGV